MTHSYAHIENFIRISTLVWVAQQCGDKYYKNIYTSAKNLTSELYSNQV